jgi:hypothetical protein
MEGRKVARKRGQPRQTVNTTLEQSERIVENQAEKAVVRRRKFNELNR